MDIEVVTIKEETAVQDKQQLINDIIRLLVDNNLSISEAKEILNITSKKLDEQKVMNNDAIHHWIEDVSAEELGERRRKQREESE